MALFTDQTGRTIEITGLPQRIISLVPSQTELLYSLGLDEEVAGITKFCVHPPAWLRHKKRVGGTKNVNLPLIHQLNPDLILANKEENIKEQVEELARQYPVWISDVHDLPGAFDMIGQIGRITGKEDAAEKITRQVKENFAQLNPYHPKPKTCYLIWREPYMTVGGDTFIHVMLETAGFENMFRSRLRYPEITIKELSAARCEVLLLASEPFPFKEKHQQELQSQLPDTKILLVDGEIFSWYGSRMIAAAGYFEKLRRQL